MQVVCSNCQLSFQAPDGATGLVCPICRSPLRGADAPAEPAAGPTRQVVDWAGGTLDDLVALLSAPAWSARVEVLPAVGETPAGEVHVIAGGVSDALHDGKSTHDALDKLRAVKGARFRIEPRLPNPSDGDLTFPGPDQGKLEERPLATLMRYCEEYVLTAGIEVWRGSENAKVDYRRGEIVGVTVGGIDAPERLAEVMKWSSGSYRLLAPKLDLPATAPKAPVPATIVAARSTGATSKTIFGMPALDPATVASAAAADKVKQAQAQARESLAPKAPGPTPSTARPSAPATSTVAPVRAPGTTAPPPAAAASPASPSTAAPPPANPAQSPTFPRPSATSPGVAASANKTIFGLQAPAAVPAAATPSAPSAPVAAPAPAAPVAAPAPTPAPPAATSAPTSRPSAPAVAATPSKPSTPAAPAVEAPKPSKTAAPPRPPAAEGDRTAPTKTAAKPTPSETPVWTYVGVGFVFGLALLGVYRLVMVLAH